MMQSIIDFLVANGSLGMFLAAFMAGTFFPFASEIVLAALLVAGASPVGLLLWGTVGNVLGGLFNYWIGSLGKEEWIARWAKVSPEKLQRGIGYVHRYGAWAGLLAWVPILGSLITVALGFLRCNVVYSALAMAVGKFARYAVLIYTLKAV